jgi:thioredoxin 1
MSQSTEPSVAELEALGGATLVEFGTSWCGHCARAQALIAEALVGASGVRHIKVEDGPGRRLGRHYKVKLWPTLVFLRDGVEVSRLVRPEDVTAIAGSLAAIGGDS